MLQLLKIPKQGVYFLVVFAVIAIKESIVELCVMQNFCQHTLIGKSAVLVNGLEHVVSIALFGETIDLCVQVVQEERRKLILW